MRGNSQGSQGLILGVCGGLDFKNRDAVFAALDAVHRKRPITRLAQRSCPTGADAFACEWAESRGVMCFGFLANWGEFGPKAGLMRDQQMIDYGMDGLVAFPGGEGIDDMVSRAMRAGVKVWKPKL